MGVLKTSFELVQKLLRFLRAFVFHKVEVAVHEDGPLELVKLELRNRRR